MREKRTYMKLCVQGGGVLRNPFMEWREFKGSGRGAGGGEKERKVIYCSHDNESENGGRNRILYMGTVTHGAA